MTRPLILDLFCGAGGAAMGYYRAGFDVIGVDNKPIPHYPFPFLEADALDVLDILIAGETLPFAQYSRVVRRSALTDFAAIHASPPCQRWSVATKAARNKGKKYPELIEPTRELLEEIGLPYVIENVPGSPLVSPVILCGSQFSLTAELNGIRLELRRHRLFEANWLLPDPGPHSHGSFGRTYSVCGHDVPSHQRKFGNFTRGNRLALKRELMGIDWMNRDELGEAIPPAYTEYVGKHLIAHERMEADCAYCR